MAIGVHGDHGHLALVATVTDTDTVTVHPLPTGEEIAVAVDPSKRIVMSVAIIMGDATTAAITMVAHIVAHVILVTENRGNDVFVSVFKVFFIFYLCFAIFFFFNFIFAILL